MRGERTEIIVRESDYYHMALDVQDAMLKDESPWNVVIFGGMHCLVQIREPPHPERGLGAGTAGRQAD